MLAAFTTNEYASAQKGVQPVLVLRRLQMDLVNILFIWCLRALSLEFWTVLHEYEEKKKKKKKQKRKMPYAQGKSEKKKKKKTTTTKKQQTNKKKKKKN